MSSRKTPTLSKSSTIVEKRISQLFKDLREASGNVRENNNEDINHGRKADRLVLLDRNLSHAFSDAFSDPALIPPPEPEVAPKTKNAIEYAFSVIKGYIKQDEDLEPVWSLDEDLKNQLASFSNMVMSARIETDPNTLLLQVPYINPATKKQIEIICEIERPETNETWDESDMVRVLNILVHLGKLLQQNQYQDGSKSSA